MNDNTDMIVDLKNVRLSYPHVFRKVAYEGKTEKEAKYSAVFVLNKVTHKEQIEMLKRIIDRLVSSKLNLQKLPEDKLCLKDGDTQEKEAYHGSFYLTSSSSELKPIVIGRKRERIDEEEGKIYGGCYVNGKISLWAQNNKFGKRINANLHAIQFIRDGEVFGDMPRVVSDDFEIISDDSVEISNDDLSFA